MKREFGGTLSGTVVLAALCLSLFAGAAFGAQTLQLVRVDNEQWSSDAVFVATEDGTKVRLTDVRLGFPGATLSLERGGAARIESFASNFLSASAPADTIPITVESGNVRGWTDAVYRDSRGNYNTVEIPPLTDPIAPASSSAKASFTFDAVENNDKRRTDIALFGGEGTSTRVSLAVYSGATLIATETVDVDGFTFHELKTPLPIGRVVATNEPPRIGAPGYSPASVRAVAFVARREGGSPRVVVPIRTP